VSVAVRSIELCAELAFDRIRQVLAVAERQQRKAWELRAMLSLARLSQRQGRLGEARAAVAAVNGTYTKTATEAVTEIRLAVERMDRFPDFDPFE
jgi:hypothetical protein